MTGPKARQQCRQLRYPKISWAEQFRIGGWGDNTKESNRLQGSDVIIIRVVGSCFALLPGEIPPTRWTGKANNFPEKSIFHHLTQISALFTKLILHALYT